MLCIATINQMQRRIPCSDQDHCTFETHISQAVKYMSGLVGKDTIWAITENLFIRTV